MDKPEKDGAACRIVRSGIRQNRAWLKEISGQLKENYRLIESVRAERKRIQDRIRHLEKQSAGEVGLTLVPLGRLRQLAKVPKQLRDAAQSTWGLVTGQKLETEMSILRANLQDVEAKLNRLQNLHQKLTRHRNAHENGLKALSDEGNRLNCRFDW